MVIFERLPYRRPQWERLSQQITEGVKQFQDAPCWEDAYFSLLELDAPRRLFMTMAVLCEAHNTGDTNDAFWAEESAWFDDVLPQFDALNARLGSALCASPWRKELEEQLGGEIFRRAEVTARAFSEQVVATFRRRAAFLRPTPALQPILLSRSTAFAVALESCPRCKRSTPAPSAPSLIFCASRRSPKLRLNWIGSMTS